MLDGGTDVRVEVAGILVAVLVAEAGILVAVLVAVEVRTGVREGPPAVCVGATVCEGGTIVLDGGTEVLVEVAGILVAVLVAVAGI